jgi:hypothetical protein
MLAHCTLFLLFSIAAASNDAVDEAPGVHMPMVGFGSFPQNDTKAEDLFGKALGVGYRMVDTANICGNQQKSGVPRAEVFISTKMKKQGQVTSMAMMVLQVAMGMILAMMGVSVARLIAEPRCAPAFSGSSFSGSMLPWRASPTIAFCSCSCLTFVKNLVLVGQTLELRWKKIPALHKLKPCTTGEIWDSKGGPGFDAHVILSTPSVRRAILPWARLHAAPRQANACPQWSCRCPDVAAASIEEVYEALDRTEVEGLYEDVDWTLSRS